VPYKFKEHQLLLDITSHQEMLLLAHLGLLLVSILPAELLASMDIISLLTLPIVLLALHLLQFALQQLSSKFAWEDTTQLQLPEIKFPVLLAQLLTTLLTVTTPHMLLHAHLDIAQLMEFVLLAHLTHKTVLEPPF